MQSTVVRVGRQRQRRSTGVSGSGSRQRPTGADHGVRDAAMVTFGSSDRPDSRWVADVKGGPVCARCFAPLTSPTPPARGRA